MNVIHCSFCESCRGLIVLPCISTNGKYSPFVWKYIPTNGEFCPLLWEFYPFVGIDSVGGINSDERIKVCVVMFVGIISDEWRNFSVSVRIYWLKRRILSIHGKWYQHSTYMCSIGRWKLNSCANGVLWYRFRRMDTILRLYEHLFTEKENFVRLPESIPRNTICNFKFNFADQHKTLCVEYR